MKSRSLGQSLTTGPPLSRSISVASQQLVVDDPQYRIKHNFVAPHIVLKDYYNTCLGDPKVSAHDP